MRWSVFVRGGTQRVVQRSRVGKVRSRVIRGDIMRVAEILRLFAYAGNAGHTP